MYDELQACQAMKTFYCIKIWYNYSIFMICAIVSLKQAIEPESCSDPQKMRQVF